MKTHRSTWLCAGLGWALGCAVLQPARAADVIINEFMAANKDAYTNHLGETSDWIELYNTTTAAVTLTGWHMTDDGTSLAKWTFPTSSIGTHQYLLVFAEGVPIP